MQVLFDNKSSQDLQCAEELHLSIHSEFSKILFCFFYSNPNFLSILSQTVSQLCFLLGIVCGWLVFSLIPMFSARVFKNTFEKFSDVSYIIFQMEQYHSINFLIIYIYIHVYKNQHFLCRKCTLSKKKYKESQCRTLTINYDYNYSC